MMMTDDDGYLIDEHQYPANDARVELWLLPCDGDKVRQASQGVEFLVVLRLGDGEHKKEYGRWPFEQAREIFEVAKTTMELVVEGFDG